MWIEVVAIILVIVWMAVSNGGVGGAGILNYYRDLTDMVSLLAILIMTLPIFFRRGIWRDFVNAVKLQNRKFSCSLGEMKQAQYAVEFLQKQLVYAGALTLIFTLITIFNNGWLDVDVRMALGPVFAIALICPFYTIMLELLILPLEIGVKRRIAEYMEEE